MADAPASGGGGSSWGPFEIILVLLLVIAIMSHLSKGSTTAPAPTAPKKATVLAPIDDSANRCGLSITAPLSSQKVYGNVRLTGSVNGCNWRPNGETALYAQVINGAGVPVSDFVAVQSSGVSLTNTAFDTTIYFNTNPANGTGYIILIPAVNEGTKSITVRVPIRFVQN